MNEQLKSAVTRITKTEKSLLRVNNLKDDATSQSADQNDWRHLKKKKLDLNNVVIFFL